MKFEITYSTFKIGTDGARWFLINEENEGKYISKQQYDEINALLNQKMK